MSASSNPDRRFLVAVDMEHYSQQDNLRQDQSQRALRTVMDDVVDRIGLDRLNWRTQGTGDGELAVLPAGISEPAVVSRLVPEIDKRLREYNQSLVPEARVRVRVALHQGLVQFSALGFAGDAVVTVCRLLNARQLKRALHAYKGAATALIVSDEVFRDVVAQRYDGLRPDRFRQVEVSLPEKNFRRSAWIYVPDEDVNQLEGLDEPESRQPPGTASGSAPAGTGGAMDVHDNTFRDSAVVFGHRGTATHHAGGSR